MKKYLLGLLTGAIIFTGVGVFASGILARNVDYDNTTSGLKDANNQDVTTVQGAIDALYNKVPDKTKTYLYNDEVDLFASTAYDGNCSPSFTKVACGDKMCKKYSFSDYDSSYSWGVRYTSSTISNITSHKKLVIKYNKIYSSGNNISHYVLFRTNNTTTDTVIVSDKAVNLQNKTVTINLDLISNNVNSIFIGAHSGINRNSAPYAFIGANVFENGYNGTASAEIEEVYFLD